MLRYLKAGFRLPQPPNCPDDLFTVMACCWALAPEERPHFSQVVTCLEGFYNTLNAFIWKRRSTTTSHFCIVEECDKYLFLFESYEWDVLKITRAASHEISIWLLWGTIFLVIISQLTSVDNDKVNIFEEDRYFDGFVRFWKTAVWYIFLT